MPTDHHVKLTLLCFTDRNCAEIPDILNLRKMLGNFINPNPGFTPPPDFTLPDDWTWPPGMETPFPLPEKFPDWPDTFEQADRTYDMMALYASFNLAWAVTCLIAIGKWKERAVEDSMLNYNTQHYREAFRRASLY
jgi:hypothetical protein